MTSANARAPEPSAIAIIDLTGKTVALCATVTETVDWIMQHRPESLAYGVRHLTTPRGHTA